MQTTELLQKQFFKEAGDPKSIGECNHYLSKFDKSNRSLCGTEEEEYNKLSSKAKRALAGAANLIGVGIGKVATLISGDARAQALRLNPLGINEKCPKGTPFKIINRELFQLIKN